MSTRRWLSSKIFKPYEYNTTSVTLLKFKSGALAKCAASVDCLQPYYFHTHLVGSEGSLLDNKFSFDEIEDEQKNHRSTLAMTMLLIQATSATIHIRRSFSRSSMRLKQGARCR